MKYVGRGLVVIGLFALLPITVSAQNCVSIDIGVTAELSVDPGYEGLYKYTISGSWDYGDVPYAVSYLMFSLGTECPCLCDSSISIVSFPTIAGTSTGEDNHGDPCEARYRGMIECSGLLETDDVVVKYEVLGEFCLPVNTGTGTWVFYSSMPPLPWAEYPDAVYVKYNDAICTGTLTGQLPDCYECVPVSVEEQSWGALKSIYR